MALVAATATAASAQWYPGQYNGQYGYGGQQQRQMQGVVTSFNAFDLYVQAGGRGNQYVRLHQGTIINPRGTTLQNGMPVRVIGYVDGGGTFQANEIDVVNNAGYGNCNGSNDGYYGNGQYGTGYYNGGNNGGYGNCSYGQGNRGHHYGQRKHHRDNDDDDRDRDNGDGNRNRDQYPNPYPTYPPNR